MEEAGLETESKEEHRESLKPAMTKRQTDTLRGFGEVFEPFRLNIKRHNLDLMKGQTNKRMRDHETDPRWGCIVNFNDYTLKGSDRLLTSRWTGKRTKLAET